MVRILVEAEVKQKATEVKQKAKAFIVDAGNRYTYLVQNFGGEGDWLVKGGHLWESGSPRVHFTEKLFLNPNTGEKRGEWAEVWQVFLPSPRPAYLSPIWCQEIWQAYQLTKLVKDLNVKASRNDCDTFLEWNNDDGLDLRSIGTNILYSIWENGRYGGDLEKVVKYAEDNNLIA